MNGTLITCILLIFALSVAFELIYPKIVGKAGEYHVRQELKKLPKDKYKVLNDIMVENDGHTVQIDHIVVSDFGIFVIETKQYNGYISGNEYDKMWRQNNKYINNPVHQNYGHIKTLEKVLALNNTIFISIVCIPSTAKVKVRARKARVLRLYQLNKTILSYDKCIVKDKEAIYEHLQRINITDKEQRQQHIKYVKSLKS